LIIGGTTKAGTTSLFIYLSDHPDICGANMKETRFFINPAYPLPAKYRYEDGLDKYEIYFNQCTHGKIRLEATPDYLYSPGTSANIKSALPKVKLIFILRDPQDRLISWCRFAKQNGILPGEISFDKYVQMQYTKQPGMQDQYLMALEQGQYSRYLRIYIETLGHDSVLVLPYSKLCKDPVSLLTRVCQYANISPDFYQTYSYKVYNPTQTVKSALLNAFYRSSRETLRMRVHNRPRVHNLMRVLRRKIEPWILKLKKNKNEQFSISEKTQTYLNEYYENEKEEIVKLINDPSFSW